MSTLPEGWGVEPEDPSVGIFGDDYYHDDCPVYAAFWKAGVNICDIMPGFTEPGHAVVQMTLLSERYEGDDGNRVRVLTFRWRCIFCGATTIVTDSDYDPTDEYIAQMEAEYHDV